MTFTLKSPNPFRRPSAIAGVVVAAAFAMPALADDAPKPEAFDKVAEAFVSLFNGTCVKYYGSPDKLTQDLESRQLPKIDAEHRAPFLHDADGEAWSLSDDKGDFVIALRKTGSCSVFARRAKDVDAQLLFATLVQSIQVPGAPMVKVADKRDDSPLGETHYVAYAQQRQTPGPFARFGLTTTPSEKVAIQAIATVSTAQKQ